MARSRLDIHTVVNERGDLAYRLDRGRVCLATALAEDPVRFDVC